MNSDLLQFVDDLANCTAMGPLTDTLDRALGAVACQSFAYRALQLPGEDDKVFYRTTYDDDWVKYYVDKTYGEIDPVVVAAERTNLPYTWQEAVVKFGYAGKPTQLFLEARDFGIRGGITVPIRSASGEFATLSVIPDVAESDFPEFCGEHKHYLHLLALNYHTALSELLARDSEMPEVRLTARQRECLKWTARGKTAWEIGEILHVSAETVVTHLNKAAEKFGVFSKHHAVVKAIMMGLIRP